MPQTIQIERLPENVEEFFALQEKVARTPQGGAAMMVVALLLYAKDEELGRKCLSVTVSHERLVEGKKGYQGWQLHNRELQLIGRQFEKQTYLPCSYMKGCEPGNGYAFPDAPYELAFSQNPYSGDEGSGRFKVFVDCSGAASPRPVTLHRDEQGLWKAQEWSSLVMGIKETSK